MKNRKYSAWILCRISNKDQMRGGSLEQQETVTIKLLKESCGIPEKEIKIFRETYSGRKNNRPVINEIMEFSRKHQSTLKYACIFDIDRFSRAGVGFYDHTKEHLKKLNIQLIDAAGVIQPERNMLAGSGGGFGSDFEYDWSWVSPSESAEIQKAHQAKEEVCKILFRVVSHQIKYVQSGYQGREASFGFKNIKVLDPKTGRKRAMTGIHPKESVFVRKMYNLAVLIQQGTLTIRKACDTINALGYRSRIRNRWNSDKTAIIGIIGGKKLDPKQFWKIIRNPYNAGFICEKWTRGKLVESKSKKLIDIEVWNKANADGTQIIKDKNGMLGWRFRKKGESFKRTYRKEHPDFPYKGLIRCNLCGKPLTAGASTGKSGKRFPLYFCNRGHKQISINPTILETYLKKLFSGLVVNEWAKQIIISGVEASIMHKLKNSDLVSDNFDEHIKLLQKRANKLYEKLEFISSKALIERIEEDYQRILEEISDLKENGQPNKYSQEQISTIINEFKKTLEHLTEFIENPNYTELLGGIWNGIFMELPSIDEIRNRTPKLSIVVRPRGSIDTQNDLWYTSGDSIRTLVEEMKRWNDLIC